MKRSERRLMIIAMFFAVVVIIGGIVAAAVAVGVNASKKSAAFNGEDTTESTAVITESITDAPTEASPCTDQCRGIPEPIHEFAHENNMSMSEWPQEMIDLLKRNPETEEFVVNYPLLKNKTYNIDLSDYENTTSVPHFLQWDERWGYAPYGDDNIGIAGCGPTCLSMVYVYLTGDTSMNPKAMAEFATDYGYCVPGNGSSWSLIHEGGEILGLDVFEVGLDENLIAYYLESGYPVICVMGPGEFTDGGHFVVMTDYIDGQIKINDPNSIIRSEKLWNFEDIENQIEGLWACSTY